MAEAASKATDCVVPVKREHTESAPSGPAKSQQFTSRNPEWSYFKLQLICSPSSTASSSFDALTARTYLTSALSQYLGLVGTSIPIDILKLETDGQQQQDCKHKAVWIRVPRSDAAAVAGAISSWVGNSASETEAVALRVVAKGNFLGALVAPKAGDLFAP